METFRKAKLIIASAAILVAVLAPTAAYPLQFAPGTQTIIVLDGRTEPPISAQSIRAEAKPRQLKRTTYVVSIFGIHVVITSSSTNSSRTTR